MSVQIGVKGAAAGATGSPYEAVLTYTSKATGNYVFNETNFAGLGKYIPCRVYVATGTPANVTMQLTTDGGTTWKQIGSTGGGSVYVDTAGTPRMVIGTGATDIFLFVIRE